MHYRSHCCDVPKKAVQLGKQPKIFSKLIEKYIRDLFDEREVSVANQKRLWKYYYKKFSRAIDLGYRPELQFFNDELVASLKNNIATFSAFKQTSFKKQLEQVLAANGNVLTWKEFKKTALSISQDYNKRWLETEYNQTIATANMAEKFEGFKRDQDIYPNLRYEAINDDRTRLKHKEWDGLVLPVNHPVWNKLTPPNDFGCRCTLIQTDEVATKNIPEIQVKQTFAHNPIESGKIFNEVPYKNALDKEEITNAKTALKGYLKTV